MPKKPVVPVTKIRLRIPKGLKVEDVVSKLEISFETVEPSPNEIKVDLSCCVDATVVSPVSVVNHH